MIDFRNVLHTESLILAPNFVPNSKNYEVQYAKNDARLFKV